MIECILLLCYFNTLQVRELTTSGVELTFTHSVEQRGEFTFPGAAYLAPEGAPNVPSMQYMLGIPQQGSVQVQVLEQRFITVQGTDIPPVVYDALFEAPYTPDIDPHSSIYTQNEMYPERVVTISEPSFLRDINTVLVTINPLQYNPVTKEARVYTYVKVRVLFTAKPVVRPILDRLFDRIYRGMIVNYEQCKNWRRMPEPDRRIQQFETGQWYSIQVLHEGLYRIGYDELVDAGIDPAQFDPRTMKIYTAAFDLLPRDVTQSFADSMVEVPVYVAGEEDASFGQNDYLVFYGFAADHFIVGDTLGWYENGYTRASVYWFTFGGVNGRRMTEISTPWNGSAPATVVTDVIHAEIDFGNPTRSGTNWYWLDVSPNEGNLGTGEVSIPHLHAHGNAQVKIGIFTLQVGPWNYRFSIDGNVYFDSLMSLPPASQFPPNYITTTTGIATDSSRILIEIIRDPTSPTTLVAYLNTIDLQYDRVTTLADPFHAFFTGSQEYTIACSDATGTAFIIDITDARAPAIFTGYTQEANTLTFTAQCDSSQLLYAGQLADAYQAVLVPENPGNLRLPLAGCEYLIITHPKFYNAVQLFVDYRRNDYTVKVVTVDDVYSDFSFGKYDPLAFKHFLYYTLNNWTIYPTYIFLIGDGTYDFRNNLGKENPPNYLPMYESGTILAGNPGMPPNFSYEGEYTNFAGGEAMVMGRLTARTPQEVRDYYDKVITYETQNTDGMWNRRIILAGDDEWSGSYRWEWNSAPHCLFCDQTIGHTPDSLYDFVKVYMVSYLPFTFPCQKPNVQKVFINELSKGAFAGLYYGHGNTHQLADEGLFFDVNIPSVKSGRRNCFFYFGSCTVGRFNDSDYECIAEQLVRVKDGAIGTMAETGKCSAWLNKTIGDTLFALLTKSDLTMGECFNISRIGEYLLLGDPAVRLNRPDPDTFAPLTVTPDSVRPLEEVSVMPPGDRFYLRVFVRDSTTIPYFDETTVDRISSRVSRQIQVSDPPSYVTFTYYIDGKEVYHGFWDDTATLYAPKVVTTHLPVMKFSSYYRSLSGMKDSLHMYGVASPTTDDAGPEVLFYDRGRQLHDGDWVSEEFTLTGKVSDESGINMLNSVNDIRGFFLYLNQDLENKVDLRDLFIYDQNSYTSGEFNVELTLPEAVDTIHFNVTDNHFNQTTVQLILNAELYGNVSIEDLLVYPNPVTERGNVWFTFTLSNAGTVSLKLFTIAGRLIRTIDNVSCYAGYNQIAWNGRDEYDDEISNGVYLVKAFVEGPNSTDEIVEKFIIGR
jgi:hypothetical protein